MFVSLANNSGYSTDQIGVVFTDEDQYKKALVLAQNVLKARIMSEGINFKQIQ